MGMVDTTHKGITKRRAIASAVIKMNKKAFAALAGKASPKGDVLATAQVAGVLAAKNTPSIIPMCHPLELGKVDVQFKLNKNKNTVTTIVDVVYTGRTGVEMEAMVAAAAASLTIYDMLKWADRGMVVAEVKLLHKSGGKSGTYARAQ